MATVLERPIIASKASADVDQFLCELTQLSHRHGLGLTNGASLYLMEPEDYARTFAASDDSDLTFA